MKTIKVYSYDELNKSAKASAYRTMAADHNFMIKQELAECAKYAVTKKKKTMWPWNYWGNNI